MVEVTVENGIVGKHVRLTYFDEQKAFRIDGKVERYDNVFLTIFSGGRSQSIPISRIIRVELI